MARKRRLDIIGVTDHGTIRGGLETQKMSRKLASDVVVVVGAEIHTNAGDLVGLFLNEEIQGHNIEVVIDEIRTQDGLVFLPHPFKGHDIAQIQSVLDRIDLVEFLNARAPLTPDESQIVASWNIPFVSSSDAHLAREIGLCRTEIQSLQVKDDLETVKKSLTNLSKQILKGSFSPPYFETMSQLIKSIKTKRYQRIPLFALIHLREILKSVQKRRFQLPDYSNPTYYLQMK